jgi:hypothetical protein
MRYTLGPFIGGVPVDAMGTMLKADGVMARRSWRHGVAAEADWWARGRFELTGRDCLVGRPDSK